MYNADYFYVNDCIKNFHPNILSGFDVEYTMGFRYERSQFDKSSLNKEAFALIRINDGYMNLELQSKLVLNLHKGDFVIVPIDCVVKYHSACEYLNYFWFNFVSDKIIYFEPFKIYKIPLAENRLANIKEMFKVHGEVNLYSNTLINIMFTQMYIQAITDNLNEEKLSLSNMAFNNILKDFESIYYKSANLAEVAEKHNISERTLRTLFIKNIGLSPKKYQIKLRMRQAVKLLQSPKISVKEVAYMLEYDTPFQFSRDFKNYYGMSPLNYCINNRKK